MIYIFEDNADDIQCQFFAQGYPKEISKDFVYAKGNGNIYGIAEHYLKTTSEYVIAYLDTIPGNKEIWTIYNKLRALSLKYDCRFIVMPLICAEYYLVKSLRNTQVMVDNTGVDICINKAVYMDSPLLKTQEDIVFCKNFEKYCKLILIKNLKECANHSGKADNPNYGNYYLKDCICNIGEISCSEEMNRDKVQRYLSQFEYIPENSCIEKPIFTPDELWEIHRNLVVSFNKMVEYYAKNDTITLKKYKKIKSII